MYVFFDVGANSGSDSLGVARTRTDAVVYAFEPTPKLVAHLKGQSADLPNYHIIPKAVSNFNGVCTFYVSGNADWGCSSICQFNDNLETTWPGRKDFKVTDSVEVDVITLENFIGEHNITHIDYLHVDAQGQDLQVLMGMGEYISIVRAGQIEMPTSHQTKLYRDQKYLDRDAIDFLVKNGFEVTGVFSNDAQRNEVNIQFKRIV
ncbi:FkbM family methyltransferase [bacterium]|nr:FkbM family methyltransferase [bacterium]NDC94441.1 FkbM family methyltransferase [bacterium]NDD84014.1 FkbM family methyltransferase [bacterium]NDG29870.1 FkbM family methyltransferase [bacterium]